LETGVERVAVESFRALAEASTDIEWLAFIHPGAASLISDTGAKTETVPYATRVERVLWQQARLPFLLRRHRADALWSPVYVAPLACPCESVILVHDIIAIEHPMLCAVPNRFHFGTLLGSCVRRASRVVVPSRAVAKAVVQRLRPRAEPVVIAPGIGSRFLSPRSASDGVQEPRATRRALGLPERFLLAVGRLERKKNMAAVVRSLSHLPSPEFRDMGLVIVGAGGPDKRKVLKAVQESPARERIRHFTRVSDEELADIYRLADCLVFPSLAEGFGIPPIESLAVGTPAVVSEYTPSYLEMCGRDQWVLPDLEPPTIARTVSRVIGGSVTEEEIDGKRRKARELTWTSHAVKISETIRSLSA
jgi:glycosyltransferase involved in cell wall biosynthesis